MHASSRRLGFTLIELLVVIGIIAVLMGIAIAVGTKVQGSGKVKSTKDMILALDSIQTAAVSGNSGQILPALVADPRLYSNRADRAATVWLPVADARAKYDQYGANSPIINSVGLFLWQARQYPEAAKLIEGLPSKMMKSIEPDTGETGVPADAGALRGQPALATALDAWGNPIRYVHPAYDGLVQDGSAAGFVQIDAAPYPQPTAGVLFFAQIRRNSIQRGDPATDPALGADSDGGQCPAGRPYFYSAGPDGDPSTISDNVYSVQPVFLKKN